MPEKRTAESKRKKNDYASKYSSTHYDRINLTTPKGAREYYKQEAARLGMSLSNFFLVAADEYLEKH